MFKFAPNVVVEEYYKELLRKGYRAEVVCVEPTQHKHATYYGKWYLRAISEATGEEYVLVTARGAGTGSKNLQPRIFRTVPGLISFLLSCGLRFVDLPFDAGTRALQRPTFQGAAKK